VQFISIIKRLTVDKLLLKFKEEGEGEGESCGRDAKCPCEWGRLSTVNLLFKKVFCKKKLFSD
jgi:hypothetical protein